MIIFLVMLWILGGSYMVQNSRISGGVKTGYFTILGIITALVLLFSLI